MTTYQMIEQSDTTDQFGQVYVNFAGNVDKAVATINSPVAGHGGCSAWVSGAKQVTVKILKTDGTALASHVCVVTVTAGNG